MSSDQNPVTVDLSSLPPFWNEETDVNIKAFEQEVEVKRREFHEKQRKEFEQKQRQWTSCLKKLSENNQALINEIRALKRENEKLNASITNLRKALESRDFEVEKLAGKIEASRTAPLVAIDLGNTGCTMSYIEDGKIHRITDSNGDTRFDIAMRCSPPGSRATDDPFEFGNTPPTTADDVTRLMSCIGRTYDELNKLIQDEKLTLPCKVVKGYNGEALFEFACWPSERFTAMSLMAILLSKLQKMATECLKQRPVTAVALIVSASFSDAQRHELIQAAHLAKFQTVHLTAITTAAFSTYQHHVEQDQAAPKKSVLIVDVGANHSEVAIFFDGKMERCRYLNVGGDYIDKLIKDDMVQVSSLDLGKVASVKPSILEDCRKLKERISGGLLKAQMPIDKNLHGGYSYSYFDYRTYTSKSSAPSTYTLESRDFAELLNRFFYLLGDEIRSVCKGLPVDEIVLSGKSTLLPQLSKYLLRLFPDLHTICRRIAYPEAAADGAALLFMNPDEPNYMPLSLEFKAYSSFSNYPIVNTIKEIILTGPLSFQADAELPPKETSFKSVYLFINGSMAVRLSIRIPSEISDKKILIGVNFSANGLLEDAELIGCNADKTIFGIELAKTKEKDATKQLDRYWAEFDERKMHGDLYNKLFALIASAKEMARAMKTEHRQALEEQADDWSKWLEEQISSPAQMLADKMEQISSILAIQQSN